MNRILFVILLLSLLSHPTFGQIICSQLKKELTDLAEAYNNTHLPDRRIELGKQWLEKYKHWGKCKYRSVASDRYFHTLDTFLVKIVYPKAGSSHCQIGINTIKQAPQDYSPTEIITSLKNCGCDDSTPLVIVAWADIAQRGTIKDCDNFLTRYPDHALSQDIQQERTKKIQYQDYLRAINGTIDDCDTFLATYPNHTLSPQVKAERQKKIEWQYYTAALDGSIQDGTTYLSKYPQGAYVHEIQARKTRLITIQNNKNPTLWSQGDRICTTDHDAGQIQAVIEQWNDNKSKLKVKIIAGYEGMYQGEDIYKGNMIWIAPQGWYKCIGDENLNYNIPILGGNGLADRTKYTYTVGDIVKCYQWSNGKAGYEASVLDKRDGKYLVKVTSVTTYGFLSISLNPSQCSGHLRLFESKENFNEEGVGSVFWIAKDCVE